MDYYIATAFKKNDIISERYEDSMVFWEGDVGGTEVWRALRGVGGATIHRIQRYSDVFDDFTVGEDMYDEESDVYYIISRIIKTSEIFIIVDEYGTHRKRLPYTLVENIYKEEGELVLYKKDEYEFNLEQEELLSELVTEEVFPRISMVDGELSRINYKMFDTFSNIIGSVYDILYGYVGDFVFEATLKNGSPERIRCFRRGYLFFERSSYHGYPDEFYQLSPEANKVCLLYVNMVIDGVTVNKPLKEFIKHDLDYKDLVKGVEEFEEIVLGEDYEGDPNYEDGDDRLGSEDYEDEDNEEGYDEDYDEDDEEY